MVEQLLIGTVTIVFDGPALHRLSTKQEEEVARGFLEPLHRALAAAGFPEIALELITTRSGCVKAKFKIWVVITAIAGGAGAFVMKYPEVRERVAMIINDVGNGYKCTVDGHEQACKAVRATWEVSSNVYQTRAGDTLRRIVSEEWFTPKDREEQVMAATLRLNAHAFVGGDANRLKPGVLLAKPWQAMLKGIPAK